MLNEEFMILKKFEDFLENNKTKFSYLRCLSNFDRKIFLKLLINTMIVHNVNQNTILCVLEEGTIKMSTWCMIMKKINPCSTYNVWRNAYWGDVKLTSFHVLLCTFQGTDENHKINLIIEENSLHTIRSLFISRSADVNTRKEEHFNKIMSINLK